MAMTKGILMDVLVLVLREADTKMAVKCAGIFLEETPA